MQLIQETFQMTGKGYADMVYLPRKGLPDKLASIVELKWNESAQG